MVSLKEASKLTGYSPDYIGQLIRNRKIIGKQIYHSVAWVVSERSLSDYLEGQGTKETTEDEGIFDKFSMAYEQIREFLFKPANVYRNLMYVGLFALSIVTVLLFYITSVSIDRKIQSRYAQKYEPAYIIQPEK